MNFPLATTLTLAAILGTATLTGTAGATTGSFPDNMVEGQTYSIQVDDGVTLADHRTDNMAWIESDGSDIQPLGYTYNQVNGTITFTLAAHDDCSNHQLDLIVGEPLAQVDRGSRNRYNRTPYGGTSRLIAATYVAAAEDCGTPATTTSTSTTVADLPPATVPPTTTATTTVVEVFRSDPIPPELTTTSTSSAVEVDVPLILEPPTTSTIVVEYAAPVAPAPSLPVTGGNTAKLLWLAGLFTSVGALFVGGAKCRQRRDLKDNQ